MSEQTHAESGTDTTAVLEDTSDHDQIALETSGEVGEVLEGAIRHEGPTRHRLRAVRRVWSRE